MTYRLLILVAFLSVGACYHSVAAGAQEVWLLSGQSNACGCGALPPLEANPNVLIFDPADGKWITAQDPLPNMTSDGLGPWHATALDVFAKTKKEIRLAGYAYGGLGISEWDPGKGTWKKLSSVLKMSGGKADVFMWYQGEADAAYKTFGIEPYKEKLKKLVARVRAETNNPKMLVVIIQIGLWGGAQPGWFTGIREGQRRFVVEDGNALLVPALNAKNIDPVHLSRDGQIELGRRISRALVKNRYGSKDIDWPGPVLDKAVLLKDGKTVVAHFAEVKKLSGEACAAGPRAKQGEKEISCFGITDAEGSVREASMMADSAKAGSTTVTITFPKTVTLPASLAYAPGEVPKATLIDEEGNTAPAVQIPITEGPEPADVFTSAVTAPVGDL